MEIRAFADSDRPAGTALLMSRQPHMQPHWVDDMFDSPSTVIEPNIVAVSDDGELAGWAAVVAREGLPTDLRFVGVTVRADVEGAGLGSTLHRALMERLAEGVALLRGTVLDDDPRSLAVAEHWGYERFQYGITSRFDLVDLPDPDLSNGLGLESCPTVPYDDDEAVLAMFDVAQTNPERDAGLFVTPAMLRDFSGKGTPVGRLAKIDGAPVGMIHGSVHGDQLHIHYACVHPDFRGRGVALAMKQQLHLDAMQAGATQLLTTNEAANTAIRTLNARLGYERLFGEYRLQRRL
ncbi:MAG: GNAT family N-acetyltransferase [Nocardioidaceae bacterium]